MRLVTLFAIVMTFSVANSEDDETFALVCIMRNLKVVYKAKRNSVTYTAAFENKSKYMIVFKFGALCCILKAKYTETIFKVSKELFVHHNILVC